MTPVEFAVLAMVLVTVNLAVIVAVIWLVRFTVRSLVAVVREVHHDQVGAVVEVTGVLEQAITTIAGAVGASVQTALAPPASPAATRDELVMQAAHQMAEDFAAREADDDTDPTDAWIGRERDEVVAGVDLGAAGATGIPGFVFDRPAEFAHWDVPATGEHG